MEIIQKIWDNLTTENELLTNIICSPFIIVDAYIGMLLFTTILNIKTNNKQRLIYILSISVLAIITRSFIPNPYGTFINMIALPIFIIFIFNTSILKSIVAELLPLLISALIEPICAKLYIIIFDIPLEIAMNTPISRLFVMFVVYSIMYLICYVTKKFNFNITLLDELNLKSKILLIITFILGLISIAIQYYIINYYSNNIPLLVTVLSTSILLAYFIMSLYSLIRTTQLEITKQNLEESQLYNKTLTILYDNIRCFKHDFNNIVQSIGGYVQTKDINGLKKYYSQLLDDCQKVHNLTALNPTVINNPAIYSLLTSKYHIADSNGIQINLEIFLDLNTLNMKIYEFCKILGILLDNAIEAANECSEKIINLKMQLDHSSQKPRQLLIIENTYKQKNIDLEKIFNKSYTTKPNNTGLGLWEIRKILKKNNNLNLFTTKKDDFFVQQLEIY